MKKIYTILLATISLGASAQVIIGDLVGTAAPSQKTSVLLEFAAGQNKGIILPYLRVLPTAPTEGTIALDAVSGTAARVKYYNGTWMDLSGQNGNIATVLATQPTIAQSPESAGAKSIIGAQSAAADGVLVLESSTKAMILPTVSDVQSIVNPAPGMMVYVNKSDAKRLAVFNGTTWSYWKQPAPAPFPVVTSPVTGKIWMDRNLGATQVATSPTDAAAFGDLYQWGRLTDGHEKRNSATTSTLSSTDVPGNSNFIIPGTSPYDWRNPQNSNLWQGVNGINNPCPSGFRIPTQAEFTAENTDYNFLKLPAAGIRIDQNILNDTLIGYYWTSDITGPSSRILVFSSSFYDSTNSIYQRGLGLSVRCIKN